MFYRAGSIVPMFARYADTLLPATAPGVTSYADPAYGRELRLVYTPIASQVSTLLHDFTLVAAAGPSISIQPGLEYAVFTVDVDARHLTGPLAAPTAVRTRDDQDFVATLPQVGSIAALESCASPGCWYFDAAAKRLQARMFPPRPDTFTQLFVE